MRLQPGYQGYVYTGFEPSQAFGVVYGGRFEHRLLSARRTSMAHQRLTLGEIRVETGCYDVPMIAQGTLPRDAICIGFMAQGGDTTRIDTSLVGQDEIQIYPPGVDLLYHAMASSHWVNFTSSEEWLQSTALQRTERPIRLPRSATVWIRLQRGERAKLSGLVADAMSLSRSLESAGGIAPDVGEALARTLTNAYVDALSNAHEARSSGTLSAGRRRQHLILACERLVLSGGDTTISLSEIAQRSGYSIRGLELIFRRSVGTTPGKWFVNMRLNGALRDLLVPGQTLTVSDIASKWGFRHKPRFAGQFFSAFGVLPGNILNRSREQT